LIEVGTSRCLFGLAPAGVYPAASVTSRAVSSYLTISPLPNLSIVGGVFSVALSVAVGKSLRRPGVTWQRAQWSPDFPRAAFEEHRSRSPGWQRL